MSGCMIKAFALSPLHRFRRTYMGEGFPALSFTHRVVSRVANPTRPMRCARKASGLSLKVPEAGGGGEGGGRVWDGFL